MFAEAPVTETLEVAPVEEVGLVAEAAGHPLPAEVIAGGIAVDQMLEKPVRSGFPMHATPVHHVGGHPHAGVIVQPARGDQLVLEGVHAGQVGAAITDVLRKVSLVGRRVVSGLEILLAVINAVTKVGPHPLPEVTPTQLIDQFRAVVPVADALEHGVSHFAEREHAVADVGGEAGHRTPEMVAAFGVTTGIDLVQARFSGLTTSPQRAE